MNHNFRENNFNLIRIVAAFAVLVAHCFPLSGTSAATIFLGKKVGIHLGEWAVNVFFAISGYLVTQSYFRNPKLSRFVQARAYRLFPPLAVCCILCALLVGPFFTTLPLLEYFSSKEVYKFLYKNSLIIHIEYNLPGVFAEIPYPEAVNGSLWSLRYELKMYIALAVLAALGTFRRPVWCAAAIIIYFIAWGLFTWMPGTVPGISDDEIMWRVSLYFVLGVCLQYFKERVVFSWSTFFMLCGIYYWSRGDRVDNFTAAIAVTYGIFCCAFLIKGFVLRYNRYSDISYGFYLWAFPVQQSLAALIPGIGFWQMMVWATLLTAGVAWLSWNYVESPVLQRLRK